MPGRGGNSPDAVLERLRSLRQHQQGGRRSPHKPLLVLLALGRLASTGSSRSPWSQVEARLADLIEEFGPPSTAGRAQRAAYPFTRLRSDGVWLLDSDVPMDAVKPLADQEVVGQLEPDLERALRQDSRLLASAAHTLVASQFPDTIAPDVLQAVGLDPEAVLHAGPALSLADDETDRRRRDPNWRSTVLQAWDRQCAFCGYDGQVAGASAGIDAAHVRWFSFEGPDTIDNGVALCVLHHKLFDLGALGLDLSLRIRVSAAYTSRTESGRAVYDLHDRMLRPRPGTSGPAAAYITWHTRQVFKGDPLAA